MIILKLNFFLKILIVLPTLLLFWGASITYAESSRADNWWAKNSQDYVGKTLHGVTEKTSASHYIKTVLAPAFEAETGIHVELELASWEDMYDKSVRDMSQGTGIYDFVFIEQDIIYAYLAHDYLVNLSQLLNTQESLKSPFFSFEDFTSYINFFREPASGDIFGVPIESFLRVYAYRKDLFEDPLIRQAFFKKYNYQLKPPVTIQQFRDISVFFTDWGKKNKLSLWGTTVQATTAHAASFYELFETFLPSFGVHNWGINLKTRTATEKKGGTLNSPAAIQALQFWLDLYKLAPPESYGSTWNESFLTFASGRIAHGWLYGENIVQLTADSKLSKVSGKILTTLPALAPNVLNNAQKGKGYIGYYDGGAFGIPRSSHNKKAALLWLQYIGQPSVQTNWTLATGRVVHKATFDDPRVNEMDHRIGNYFSLVRDHGYLYSGAPPLAEHAAIREIISPFIYQVIRGELRPSEALNLAAVAVDSLLEIRPQ